MLEIGILRQWVHCRLYWMAPQPGQATKLYMKDQEKGVSDVTGFRCSFC